MCGSGSSCSRLCFSSRLRPRPRACTGAEDDGASSDPDQDEASEDLPYVALKGEAGRTLVLRGANFMALEADAARDFGRDHACGNEKLKNTGWRLICPDPRHGLRDTKWWYKHQ